MTHPPDPSATDSDTDAAGGSLELTLEFDAPVTAEDLHDRFQELADAIDGYDSEDIFETE